MSVVSESEASVNPYIGMDVNAIRRAPNLSINHPITGAVTTAISIMIVTPNWTCPRLQGMSVEMAETKTP